MNHGFALIANNLLRWFGAQVQWFKFISVLFLCLNCIQSTKNTLEYINPPINLTVTQIAPQTYQIAFYSDNREGGFVGYGIFVATNAAAAATYPENGVSAATHFCSLSGQANYQSTVTIEVGPAAGNGNLCNHTGLLLAPGQYIAVRGRVERLERPWSEAALAQVP